MFSQLVSVYRSALLRREGLAEGHAERRQLGQERLVDSAGIRVLGSDADMQKMMYTRMETRTRVVCRCTRMHMSHAYTCMDMRAPACILKAQQIRMLRASVLLCICGYP